VTVLAAEHGFSSPELTLDNIGDQLVIAPRSPRRWRRRWPGR
jgi:hypothetical protein